MQSAQVPDSEIWTTERSDKARPELALPQESNPTNGSWWIVQIQPKEEEAI